MRSRECKLIFDYYSHLDSDNSRFGATETFQNSSIVFSWQSRRWKCCIQTRYCGNVPGTGETRKFINRLKINGKYYRLIILSG